jgi:hypothetical protein
MTVQDSLDLVDLALIDGALRQHDDIDAAGLVPSRGQDAIQKVQIEPFGWDEFEESERLALQPLHRPSTGRKSDSRTRSGHGSNRKWTSAVCGSVPG